MKQSHKVLGVGAILGLLLTGFEVWDHVRVEWERTVQQQEWKNDLERRVCALEGGHIWRGECVKRRHH